MFCRPAGPNEISREEEMEACPLSLPHHRVLCKGSALVAVYSRLSWMLHGRPTLPKAFLKILASGSRRGGLNEDSKSNSSIFLLASSAFIVWIFAKSINNASTLGAKYGILGGFAYGEPARNSTFTASRPLRLTARQ